MKGVMDKLSSTFGKKPKETKKTSSELDTRPSTFPTKSRIYTGTVTRSNLPFRRGKDTQIPKPGTSKDPTKETFTRVSPKGSSYSPRFNEGITTKTSQIKDSKIYMDTVEDKTNRDKTPKTLQTDDSKLYRDAREDKTKEDKTPKTLQTDDSKLYRDAREDKTKENKTSKTLQTDDSELYRDSSYDKTKKDKTPETLQRKDYALYKETEEDNIQIDKTTKIPQPENPELYSEIEEEVIIKEVKPPPNTPRKLRQPRIGSDHLTDRDTKYGKNVVVDDNGVVNTYVSGSPNQPRTDSNNQTGDPLTNNDGETDESVPGKYGETLVKALQFFQDASDDDDTDVAAKSSNFAPIEKDEDREASASPFIEYPDSDNSISLDIKRDTAYLLPKSDPSPPKDPQVTKSNFKTDTERHIGSDDLATKDDRRPPKPDGRPPKPDQVSDGYNERLFLSDRLSQSTNNFSNQAEEMENTSVVNQDRSNYIHNNKDMNSSPYILEDFHPCESNENQRVANHDYSPVFPSGQQHEGDRILRQDYDNYLMDIDGLDGYGEGAYCIYGSNEDIGNMYGQPVPSMYDQQRYYYDDDTFDPDYRKNVEPFRLNNDQDMRRYHHESTSGPYPENEEIDRHDPEGFIVEKEHNTNRVSRDDSPERDVVTPKCHETQIIDPETPKDMTITLSQDSGGSPVQQSSLFGRWMVTHGQLVDPNHFCHWYYATYPDLHIDLSKYEMDLQGRWKDTSGRYMTPFFYCFSYDGEPVYLGDCDYYNVFKNTYEIIDTDDDDDDDDFANNPERFIDLSNFQMDMKQRWMDCGEYVESISDWYDIDDDDNPDEYYDHGSLYIEPASPNLSRTDRYNQYFSQEDLYSSDANSLVTIGSYRIDYPEDYVFWNYPRRYGDSTDIRASMQNLWLGSGDFYDDLHSTKEDDFGRKEDPYSCYPRKIQSKYKTK